MYGSDLENVNNAPEEAASEDSGNAVSGDARDPAAEASAAAPEAQNISEIPGEDIPEAPKSEPATKPSHEEPAAEAAKEEPVKEEPANAGASYYEAPSASVPPQHTAQPQQQYSQQYGYHQPPRPPYNPSQGYYVPQTNEFVYAPQPPKKKKNVGKAILIAIAAVLCVFVISVGSISAYSFINGQRLETNNERQKVDIDKEFRQNYDDEDVAAESDDIDRDEPDDDDGEEDGEKENLSINRTPLRDFPTLEQLASPEDAMAIPDIYDKVSPSVVGVSCKVARGTQLGTGFIISEDGYIITNAHVIDGHTASVMVVDSDLNEYEAEIIGSDEQSDIAVLKIDPSDFDLVPVEFGKSSDLRIGELAIAIGNPLGFDLYGTMTTGIISGLNRTVTVEDNTMTLLQTSASINNGNSGGPLIDAYGHVIGITSAKIDSMYGESLGFAIPIDEALPIVTNLIQYGYVIGRPSIGISGQDISELLSIYYGIPRGVLIYSVTDGSGAQKAGIQPDDVIIAIEGETITGMNELNEVKNRYKVGDTITLTIYRPEMSEWGQHSGKSFDVEVVLTEAYPTEQQ